MGSGTGSPTTSYTLTVIRLGGGSRASTPAAATHRVGGGGRRPPSAGAGVAGPQAPPARSSPPYRGSPALAPPGASCPPVYGAWISPYRSYRRCRETGLRPRFLHALQESETDV